MLVYYTKKHATESLFNNCATFTKFMVFEVCVAIFLLVCFLFSFDSPESWMGADLLAWLQILAAAMILINISVEFFTMVTKVVLTLIGLFRWIYKKNNKHRQKGLKKSPSKGKSKQERMNQEDEINGFKDDRKTIFEEEYKGMGPMLTQEGITQFKDIDPEFRFETEGEEQKQQHNDEQQLLNNKKSQNLYDFIKNNNKSSKRYKQLGMNQRGRRVSKHTSNKKNKFQTSSTKKI